MAHDGRRHVGLVPVAKADVVEVRWPSGARSTSRDLEAGRGNLPREGRDAPEPLAGHAE